MIYGRTLILDVRMYPEVIEDAKRFARESVAVAIEADGLRPDGTTRIERIEYARREREQHHEHGWQMVTKMCQQEEAEEIWFTVEQAAVPA